MKKTPKLQKIKPNIQKIMNYSFGESHSNKYLNCSFTEILNKEKNRVGWIWKHTNGKIVVMPNMGFHIWFNEGEEWTVESGALWLVKHASW